MIDLIIKKFIKNHTSTTSATVRENYGKVAGGVGITTNIFLFLIKFSAGLFSKSVSIMADAINNLSDAGSSIITVIGFKMSGKPADKEHPYGHARMEYICGLVISFVVVILGFELVKSSFDKILHPTEINFSFVTIAILIVAIATKVWQGFFYTKFSKTINSTALKASATDSFSDVLATSGVLVSTILSKIIGFNLDGYMGVIVAIIIIISGVKLIGETINPLLGVAPEKAMVKTIKNKILSYDGIIGMHDLNIHNYGQSRRFASVHVEVSASQDIMISHDIIDNIERDFEQDLDIHLVIHLDPVITDDERVSDLREQVKEKLMEIDHTISMHDFRVVFGTTHTNIIFDVCVGFNFKYTDCELAEVINEKVKELSKTYFAVVVVDHVSYS